MGRGICWRGVRATSVVDRERPRHSVRPPLDVPRPLPTFPSPLLLLVPPLRIPRPALIAPPPLSPTFPFPSFAASDSVSPSDSWVALPVVDSDAPSRSRSPAREKKEPHGRDRRPSPSPARGGSPQGVGGARAGHAGTARAGAEIEDAGVELAMPITPRGLNGETKYKGERRAETAEGDMHTP